MRLKGAPLSPAAVPAAGVSLPVVHPRDELATCVYMGRGRAGKLFGAPAILGGPGASARALRWPGERLPAGPGHRGRQIKFSCLTKRCAPVWSLRKGRHLSAGFAIWLMLVGRCARARFAGAGSPVGACGAVNRRDRRVRLFGRFRGGPVRLRREASRAYRRGGGRKAVGRRPPPVL